MEGLPRSIPPAQIVQDGRWTADAAPTWRDLATPSEAELSAVLRRLVAATVVVDPHVNRREAQMRELLHLMLVKLESDAVAGRPENRDRPVDFRIHGEASTKVALTARRVRELFKAYFRRGRGRIFHARERGDILLADETIHAVVAELWRYRILGDANQPLSKAFQVFRTAALKSGEGQYLTPPRIVRPVVTALDITAADTVIDPACGTGGFLIEAMRQVAAKEGAEAAARWSTHNLHGIDKDDIGVKLARAELLTMGSGSLHVLLGDAVRAKAIARLAGRFSVVVTNPPFGEELKVAAQDCRAAGYTISGAAAMGGPADHADLEIGLVYLELAHRLLEVGGRVGILLPETYFFSRKYRWLPAWLDGRFKLRGMTNIAMEAFEEFCRAKTNFYVFEKVGQGGPVVAHRPAWFSDDRVMVSTAETCGLARGGRPLRKVDRATGEPVEVLDDQLRDDMQALAAGICTATLGFVPAGQVSLGCAVPVYHDRRFSRAFHDALRRPEFQGFTAATIGALAAKGLLALGCGHGSPSQELRVGDVPYIKVSDLRAGLVNINPTNRVPRAVAERYWRGAESGLEAFDLLCPGRTSKNIGDFCVLMPGQEQVLLTKEVIVLRPGPAAGFDAFYLLWALTLKIVRDQWRRIVFMQTNREDVGRRFLEIEIPMPPDAARAALVSEPFRVYFRGVAEARTSLQSYLARAAAPHHFFVAGDGVRE
jgi:type I restriction enzyme M protein